MASGTIGLSDATKASQSRGLIVISDEMSSEVHRTSSESVHGASDFPRVLVISPHVISLMAGSGGVMMSNLFMGWPLDRMAAIYTQRQVPPDPERCAIYYGLYPRITMQPGEWLRRGIDYVRGENESLDGITSFRMTKHLWHWIEEFSPQVVYSHLGPLSLTRLTNLVVTKLRIPLVVHIMDDYIKEWPVNGVRRRDIFPIAPILHRLNQREFLRSLASARVRLAISHEMGAEYQRRYGCSFAVTHNGVNPDEWPLYTPEDAKPASPFRILYSGGIAENQNLRSLAQIGNAVTSIAARGHKIRLDIASTGGGLFREVLERPPDVQCISVVPRADLPRRLAEYDLLVIPYNFDDDSIQLFRLSWPTKLPEYMLSGTPILLFAPPGLTFVEYARRHECAYVVDNPGQQGLETALIRLMMDHLFRRDLAVTARQVALRHEDMKQIRFVFQEALRSVAIPTREGNELRQSTR